MKTTIQDLVVSRGTEGIGLMLSVPFREAEEVKQLQKQLDKGKSLEVEIKPLTKARTLSANNYCWHLCDEIAKKVVAGKGLLQQRGRIQGSNKRLWTLQKLSFHG